MFNKFDIFFSKAKNFIRKHREMLVIPKRDLVLDVGAGHSPWERADIVCDKFDVDDSQRPGKLARDRPVVVGDVQALPFRNKVFGYVWCSHVLEHVDDPSGAVAELSRVSEKGYIETPSEFHEKLIAEYEYHKWFVNSKEGILYFKKKERPILDNSLIETMSMLLKSFENSTLMFYKNNYYAKKSPFLVKHFWKDKVDCVIEEASFDEIRTHNQGAQINNELNSATENNNKSGPLDANFLERVFRDIMLWGFRLLIGKRSVNLDSVLACPFCKQKVQRENETYICEACSKAFPIKEGVPIMLKEKAENI